jgi:hypothetical protein
MADDNFSQSDLDMIARTVLAEGGVDGAAGMAAVANVIRNRYQSGDYGSSIPTIVHQPGQFSAWSLNRRDPNYPGGFSPRDPDYQQAYQIAQSVFSGQTQDPTHGAVNYYSPGAMLGNATVPAFAAGRQPSAAIGRQLFFGPQAQANATVSAAPAGQYFANAGYDVGTPAAANPPDASGPPNPIGQYFANAGYDVGAQGAKPNMTGGQFAGEIPIPVPGQAGYDVDTQPNLSHADQIENELAEFTNAIRPGTVLPEAAANWWNATKQAFGQGAEEYSKGVATFPAGHWASGSGIAGLGILGMAGAPLTGALNAFIGNPVTQMTGNPQIGQDVAQTAGLLLPTKVAPAAIQAGADTSAINALVRTIGPENVPAVVDAARANPRTMLMDVSPPVRTVSRGLLDPAQPTAQNIITQAVRNRSTTLPSWVNSAYTATMGSAPNVPLMLDALKQRAQQIGAQQINPVLASAKPVDVSPVLDLIDKEFSDTPIGIAALRTIKKGDVPAFPLSDYQQNLLSIRNQLASNMEGGQHFLDADGEQGAHAIQATIRAQAQNLLQSATGSDRLLGGKLMNIRNATVDAIDQASGGTYKPALSNYRDAMQVQEAFNDGFSGNVLKNRPGHVEDTPDAFDQWMNQATPEQIVAKRLGTRANIDMQIRGAKNQSLVGQNIAGIEYNQDKLSSLFGDQEANRLIGAMMSAQQEARTTSSILGGSETAQTLAGQKALERTPIGGGNMLNWMGAPAAEAAGEYFLGPAGMGLGAGAFAGIKGVQYGIQAARRALDTQRNISFARAASATGSAKEPVLNALMNHPAVVRQLQRQGTALSAAIPP